MCLSNQRFHLLLDKYGVKDSNINTKNFMNLFSNTNVFEKIKINKELNKKDIKKIWSLFRNDSSTLFMAIFSFLHEEGKEFSFNKEYIIKECPSRSVVMIDKLLEVLSQEELEEILGRYKNVKKEEISILIDLIENPEKEEYQMKNKKGDLSLKEYFEEDIRRKQEKNIEEQKSKEAERIDIEVKKETKKKLMNNVLVRFENGEGDYKNIKKEEIFSVKNNRASAMEIAESQNNEKYTEGKKLKILEESLLDLVTTIRSSVPISREMILKYINIKKEELISLSMSFEKLVKIVHLLDKSGDFSYRINISSGFEELKLMSKDDLERNDNNLFNYLNDLFKQSLYYVSPAGISLRLKLFDLKENDVGKVIQPIMEQIFFNKKIVDYTDKKILELSGLSVKEDLYTFEMSSFAFQKELKQETFNDDEIFKSRVGVISEKNNNYVNISKAARIHSGWKVVDIKEL